MPFYADIKVILPLLVATVALVAAAVIVAFRWKNSESNLTNTHNDRFLDFSHMKHSRSLIVTFVLYLNKLFRFFRNAALNICISFDIFVTYCQSRGLTVGCVCQDTWEVKCNGR